MLNISTYMPCMFTVPTRNLDYHYLMADIGYFISNSKIYSILIAMDAKFLAD